MKNDLEKLLAKYTFGELYKSIIREFEGKVLTFGKDPEFYEMWCNRIKDNLERLND